MAKIANRISPKDLGDPTPVRNYDNDADRAKVLPLGTIIGEVRGLTFRADVQDPGAWSIGLAGIFEGIPADPKAELIKAPVAWLPKAVHDTIVRAVMGDTPMPTERPKRGSAINMALNGVMPIAVEIGARFSKGSVGYEFVTVIDETNLKVIDPLQALKAQLKITDKRSIREAVAPISMAPRVELPAPSDEQVNEAPAEPVKGKAKAKRKR